MNALIIIGLLGAYSIILTIVYYFELNRKDTKISIFEPVKEIIKSAPISIPIIQNNTNEIDLYKLQVERYKNEILELHKQLERCLKLLEK